MSSIDPVSSSEPCADHDEVVARSLEIVEQMGREHHGQSAARDRRHQRLQERPSGERVEAGDRFVEQQQLGLLRQCERQRQLCPLPA